MLKIKNASFSESKMLDKQTKTILVGIRINLYQAYTESYLTDILGDVHNKTSGKTYLCPLLLGFI